MTLHPLMVKIIDTLPHLVAEFHFLRIGYSKTNSTSLGVFEGTQLKDLLSGLRRLPNCTVGRGTMTATCESPFFVSQKKKKKWIEAKEN